uniref:Ig-like domain-containing protein n=1 Tax=Aeromonas tecta TaxID=324617 RepID=UPI0018DD5F6D
AIATVNTTGLATALAAGPATISVSLNGISATAYLNVTAATLTAIQLTPATSSIASRLTQQYIAQGTYSDNTSADISNMVAWHSSDTTVATVNTAGLATTLIAGSTTISASLNGITTFAHLDVTAATLTAIQLTPATASIVAGLTQQYTAQGTYSNNLSVDISSMVAWHSSDTAIATVDTTGLATTLTAGPATISVSLDGISATATLGVRPSSPRVVTWGATFYGGDSSAVQAQLTNVSAIYSTGGAFAALKQDGSVVTWGNAGFGGDSSAVQAQLTNVRAISNSDGAFAALKQDGSVVTWGSTVYGGDSSAVQ